MTTPYLTPPVFSWPAAPGGKLHTYAAGGVLAQATYSDAAGVTLNTNPVTLDSLGSAVVRLAVGVAYHFVLKDATDVTTIWDADNYDNAYLTSGTVTAAVVGAALYPQTAAELAAGVTPTLYNYAPGNVLRYGALGDGATNDAPAFQKAINIARQISSGTVYAPTGNTGLVYIPAPPGAFYMITSELDCSITGGPNQHGLIFRADAGASTDAPTIILKHTDYGFNFTGCDAFLMDNLSIGTDTTTYPKVCFFESRNISNGAGNQGPNAGFHRYQNVRVHGKFSKTLLYNYGSESNVYANCLWVNEAVDIGSKCCTFTISNILALTSSFGGGVATGNQSTIDHQIVGGQFESSNTDPTSDAFYLDAVSHLKMFGPWILAQGRSGIYVDGTVAGSAYIRLFAFQIENGVNNLYGIRFGGEAVSNSANWTISGCNLSNLTFAISAHANATLDSFFIEGVSEAAGAHGISVAGTIQSSILLLGFTTFIAGTSKQNTLVGDASRWTITTRNADYWIDHGGVKNAWVPALGTVAHGGAITFNENRCLFEGNMVHFELLMTDTVSITATLAQTITGLPVAALRRSADIIFVNANTAAALGTGFIQAGATSIQCPAFSVGAGVSVCVSGSYFVA